MAKLTAQYRNFIVRLEVPEGQPLDTPEHRDLLLKKLGALIVSSITNQVRFFNE